MTAEIGEAAADRLIARICDADAAQQHRHVQLARTMITVESVLYEYEPGECHGAVYVCDSKERIVRRVERWDAP